MGWGTWFRQWFGESRPPAPAANDRAVPAAMPPPDERIVVSREEDGDVRPVFMRLKGVLNTTTARDFEEQLTRFIEAGDINLVVDFSGVPYVSSRGWGILVSVVQTVRQRGGDIKIAGMCPNVVKLFHHTGLSAIFEVYSEPSTESA